jgi:hypothetical protein
MDIEIFVTHIMALSETSYTFFNEENAQKSDRRISSIN